MRISPFDNVRMFFFFCKEACEACNITLLNISVCRFLYIWRIWHQPAIYIYRKIETDLLHSSASNNETKKQGSVGSTMYKANLQRCRSVTLCISRFSPRALPRLSLCFFYFMYTMHSFFELYGFCGFSISLPLILAHHSHSVSSFFFFSFLFFSPSSYFYIINAFFFIDIYIYIIIYIAIRHFKSPPFRQRNHRLRIVAPSYHHPFRNVPLSLPPSLSLLADEKACNTV